MACWLLQKDTIVGRSVILTENLRCWQNVSGYIAALTWIMLLCRSDLSLVCSPKELDLLKEEYQIPAAKLQLASFFVSPSSLQAGPGFHERSHFMTIGNFRYPTPALHEAPFQTLYVVVLGV